MLNAYEANEAANAIAYPATKGLSKEERLVQVAEYRKAQAAVTEQFKAWLANEYADELPTSIQDRIWRKAWEDGHSAGYTEVEFHYTDLAEFAEAVLNADR